MPSLKLSLLLLAALLFVGASCDTGEPTTVNTAPPAPAAPASPASPAQPGDEMAASRAIFGQTCAKCHGANGEGGMVGEGKEKIKVPSLREGHALKHSDAQLIEIITNGDKPMPAFKDKLNPEQINEIVRFIRKEFQGGGTGEKDSPQPQSSPAAPKS